MKLFKLTLLGLALTSSGAFGFEKDSGQVATDDEYVFSFSGDSKGGSCKEFVGPRKVEVFQKENDDIKVAEITRISVLEICERDGSYSFKSKGRSQVQNKKRYRISNVRLKMAIKDKSESRIGSRKLVAPKYTTSCGTDKVSNPGLSGKVSKGQFKAADSIVLTVGDGNWIKCR